MLQKFEAVAIMEDGSKVFGKYSGLRHGEKPLSLFEDVTDLHVDGTVTKHSYMWVPSDRVTIIREVTLTKGVNV